MIATTFRGRCAKASTSGGENVRLADIFELLLGRETPLGFKAYDGSVAGPRDADAVIEVRSPAALSYLATKRPGLGLARAYLTAEIEVHGDLYAALRCLAAVERNGVRWRNLVPALPRVGVHALQRPPIPQDEAPARWRRGSLHSKRRDAAAISHHYDVSNRFYELVLGSSMAYSCGVFPTAYATLEEAQAEKFHLVCRKLDLSPGQRLLDFGGGWGGMITHAAKHYGVHALGITLSHEQAAYANRAISRAGLERRAEMRLLDYRDLRQTGFDAISSIGAMEHVGTARLGAHFTSLAARLRPEGRLLNHCITRPSNHERNRAGHFIDRYVFPDGELQGLGTVVGAIHDHGFEVRHAENLREHYALTLREWTHNLDRQWAAAVAEAGERRARIWRLYMAASRVGFELNRIQVHQVLGVRAATDGGSGLPLRPRWERPTHRLPAPADSKLVAAA
jgi:cyclopropane-fatty-acyl-phospholipid synthase